MPTQISDTPSILTNGLSRYFKQVCAVDALSLSIAPGTLFGLVGPDGAGKTTTLRLLAGLLRITEGSANIAGFDLESEAEKIKSRIGYMSQEFSLYGELTVNENLYFFAELQNVDRKQIKARAEHLLRFAGIVDFTQRRAKHLSGGMKKKLALACSLIHQPEILLLDEPTTGVDPISRREFWEILTDLHLSGTTILVSTPYMDEADRCSKIGLMYQGKLVICDTPAKIRQELKGDMLALKTPHWQEALHLIKGLPGVVEIQTYGNTLHLIVENAEKVSPAIYARFKTANLAIESLREINPRMEEAFISLINQLKEDEAHVA